MPTSSQPTDAAPGLYDVYVPALDAMKTTGPKPLGRRVAFEAEDRDHPELADPKLLAKYLEEVEVGDNLLFRLRQQLANWDAEAVAGWAEETLPRTSERRALIYERLELPEVLQEAFDRAMPAAEDGAVIVSRDFEPWYGQAMQQREPFYWSHYADYLTRQGWHEDAIAALDLNTTRVVERLADPERQEAYQAKGLVVGYVQSGKTANFTGVLAKAIDAGYRLLIVLTGTTDLLRGQTQRRLDKELVGRENLLRGVDPDDEEALLTVDHYGDPDWDDFVSHATLPSMVGASDILRLTTHRGDYKSLQQGISSLDFERFDPAQPLNVAVNLHRVPARIAVVKKNSPVLKKLVRDLRRITAKLAEIPALIIDDESDQASINTSNPAKWEQGRTERTAINRLISQLLELLPRGQYIGYTATPFANVFVDPADSVDIFPRDFILSLDRPPGYMGPSDFHDLDDPPEDDEDRDLTTSNELAFVRPVGEDPNHEALQRAVDSFVLTGAIKLYREEQAKRERFRHHTMLVHESVRVAEHRELADEIRELWKCSGFYSGAGLRRLHELFDGDFLPVMSARAGEEPISESFADVKPFLGEAISRIEGSAGDPVLVVNSDQEARAEDLDFEHRRVWRILVGGAKLSRGFTVEGLTISYYRRVTRQQDTLMQMGRWFGFRRGYRDLVRLYIRRASGRGADAYDLYEAFEAACLAEQLFRTELEKYAHTEDGVPQITPVQVPPLVAQHLGWLRPSAGNKMYNARLVERRSPGEHLEPTGYPESRDALASNAEALRPVIEAADNLRKLSYPTATGSERPYDAWTGVVTHHTLLAALRDVAWQPHDHFEPDLTWLEGLRADQVEDWAVILPQHLGSGSRSTVLGRDNLSVFHRQRRRAPLFGAVSDPKHRWAANRIAGVRPLVEGDAGSAALHGDRRAALLIYPVIELHEDADAPPSLGPGDFVPAIVLLAPLSAGADDGALVRFVVRDRSRPDEAIVDAG